MKLTSSDFWDINWGPDEAKGDKNLQHYFLEIPEYAELKKGNYRYVIGRKGTGKTAIIEQIKLEAESQYDSFYKYLSLKDFPIQILRGLKDRTQGGKSQFVPIWTFLILTELSKLIIQDEVACPSENVEELRVFITTNFPSDLGFSETLKCLASRENKVSVLPKWAGLESSSMTSQESLVSIHYQKATDSLIDNITRIKSKCKFYLLFDELDEGYSANDKGLNLLLLALLRAVENTYLDLNAHINVLPILALRSDIFDNLEDNDLNKLDDYIINLKWTKEYGTGYSLYDLVNARINASVDVLNPANSWECVADNNDKYLPEKVNSLWDYIINRTFERPRDMIKYMKCCNSLKQTGRLDFNSVYKAEIKYSEWFFKEFRDEIQSHLPVWKEVSQALIKMGKPIFTMDDIKPEFDKDKKILNFISNTNTSHEDILKLLFDFSLIGTLSDSGKWLFNYKYHNLPFNSDHRMIVHFGFTRNFRMKV